MIYEVVRTSPHHIRPMARRLRAADCVLLESFGFDPRRALHRVVMLSHHCRTAMQDGKPIAMWGVIGSLLGSTATIWLVMSRDVEWVPLSVVREARRELEDIAGYYDQVAATVMQDDEAAIRFALHLGFDADREADSPIARKARVQAIMQNTRRRVPIGDSFIVELGYHHGERAA